MNNLAQPVCNEVRDGDVTLGREILGSTAGFRFEWFDVLGTRTVTTMEIGWVAGESGRVQVAEKGIG